MQDYKFNNNTAFDKILFKNTRNPMELLLITPLAFVLNLNHILGTKLERNWFMMDRISGLKNIPLLFIINYNKDRMTCHRSPRARVHLPRCDQLPDSFFCLSICCINAQVSIILFEINKLIHKNLQAFKYIVNKRSFQVYYKKCLNKHSSMHKRVKL